MNTNGITLAQQLYEEHGKPLLQKKLPNIFPRMAFGLVGEGSECFGFDDVISRDHDWGPAFCIWMPQDDMAVALPQVQATLKELPSIFNGFATRMHEPDPNGRIGLLSIESFYARFTRLPTPPQTWREWRTIPEHFLAVCTNGKVFEDGLGQFSAHRKALLDFYPDDVRLKKISARCATLAQAGQYNLPRVLRRGDAVTAALTVARAAEQAMSLIFLLNRQYMPFYKWAFRALNDLPVLGKEVSPMLEELLTLSWAQGAALEEQAMVCMERLCEQLCAELQRQNLSDVADTWLMEHAEAVQARIATPELRNMPLLLE